MIEDAGNQAGKWGEGQGGRRCRRLTPRAGLKHRAGLREEQGAGLGARRAPASPPRYEGEPARTPLLPQDFLRQHAHPTTRVWGARGGCSRPGVHAQANATDTHKAPAACRFKGRATGSKQPSSKTTSSLCSFLARSEKRNPIFANHLRF